MRILPRFSGRRKYFVALLVAAVLICQRSPLFISQAIAASPVMPLESPGVVISQIYGGGGNSGAPLQNDYIELFNRGASSVSLSDWSLQYASATGTGNFGASATQITELPNITLAPGAYLLVQEVGGTAGAPLPTPDVTDATPINMSATAGKVALVNSATPLGCNGGSTTCSPAALASIVDLVGFGNANFYEGTAATAPSNTTAIFRQEQGCTDTDQNSTDFATGAPAPRNAASPLRPCGGGGGEPSLSINDVTVTEGNGGTTVAAFTVSLSSPAGANGVTFDIATADATATIADNDYVAASLNGQTISADAQEYSFSVTINGDTKIEPDETFTVNIANVIGGTIAKGQGTLTIANDDVTLTAINAVQGGGSVSPYVNTTVTTAGIITSTRNNGFFIQTPDAEVDRNPDNTPNTATSEGLFVFTGSTAFPAANVGNRVNVTGPVAEFKVDANALSVTEISRPTNVTLIAAGGAADLPAPVTITTNDYADASNSEPLEKYEGMRVRVARLVSVSPSRGNVNEANATGTDTGVFFGVVEGLARPFREPGISVYSALPAGAPANIPRFDNNQERLRVDTGNAITPLEITSGALVTDVTGPLDYAFATHTILVDPPSVTPTPVVSNLAVATPVPAPLTNEFTVGSFNLERFFDTTNDPSIGEPVLTQQAFAGRLNKASLAIRNVMRAPDILGVEEVENKTTLEALAAKINNDAVAVGDPDPQYQAILEEGNDIGGIDVGFLVKTSRVGVVDYMQEGKTTPLTDSNGVIYTNQDGSPQLLNDRPPLILRASVARGDGDAPLPFTVIVNHLRSLNGVDDETTGDGVRVRDKRRGQAEFLADLIQRHQTAGERVVSVGDYNAFEFSDGYVDVMGIIKGTPAPSDQVVEPSDAVRVQPSLTDLIYDLPAAQQYSYSFDGNAQTLDHVLVNAAARALLTRFAYARNDADFPESYRNDTNRSERVSDHDMPVAYFSLNEDVTNRVSVARSGLSYSRATRTYNGTVTITNTSAQDINGPLQLVFSNLSSGAELVNRTGTYQGASYLTVSGAALAAGASVTVPVRFSNPANAFVSYAPVVYSGNF